MLVDAIEKLNPRLLGDDESPVLGVGLDVSRTKEYSHDVRKV